MRLVKIPEDAQPYKRWQNDAGKLTQDLYNADSEQNRKNIIDNNQSLWKRPKFREWMVELFHKKCWYTESKEKVSAYHVDHFRPKGRVSDSEGSSEGYWWIAFDWKNYRIAGQLINVKKKDRFPINGTFRASIDDQRIEIEDAQLIDPLDEEDVALISFDESGEVVCAGDISEKDKKRVEVTNDILGLNKIQNLVEARQEKWSKCHEYINDYLNADKYNNPLRKFKKANAKIELKKMINEKEEFSAVALACIRKKAPEPLQIQILS